jgi:plastocyanin
MKRGILICLIVSTATIVLGMPGAALAGGGCHSGTTYQDASGEKEATVRMVDACFTASVTEVDPGVSLTFVSDDAGITHNVGGNGWGYLDDMSKGDAFTATFDEPGIYPFACSYHPGMTGAIVVGDGTGAGNGSAVSVEPFDAPAPETVARVVAGDTGLSGGSLVTTGVVGIVAGIGMTVGFARLGRRRVTS